MCTDAFTMRCQQKGSCYPSAAHHKKGTTSDTRSYSMKEVCLLFGRNVWVKYVYNLRKRLLFYCNNPFAYQRRTLNRGEKWKWYYLCMNTFTKSCSEEQRFFVPKFHYIYVSWRTTTKNEKVQKKGLGEGKSISWHCYFWWWHYDEDDDFSI